MIAAAEVGDLARKALAAQATPQTPDDHRPQVISYVGTPRPEQRVISISDASGAASQYLVSQRAADAITALLFG